MSDSGQDSRNDLPVTESIRSPNRDGRFRRSVRQVYLHAILALVLPSAFLALAGTRTAESLITFFLNHAWAAWLAIFALAGLAYIECQFLVTLGRLLLLRGDAASIVTHHADPVHRRRAKYRRFALLTVTISLALSLVMLELVFRMFDISPPEGKFPKASLRDRVDNSVNALGLREPWESIADDDARRRIAFLGDSFVYGYGVEREKCFTSLVEQRMTGVVTMNMGGIGTNPKDQYAVFQRLRDELNPEVLVHVIYLNDLDFYLGDLLNGIHYIPRQDSWLAGQSRLFRYMEKSWQAYRAYHKTLAYFSGGETEAARRKSWEEFRRYVKLIRDSARDGDCTYRMVIFPWLYQLDDYPLPEVHEKIRSYAAELSAPVLDLLPTFEGRDAEKLRISDIDSHGNETAHGLAADAIVEFLKSSLEHHNSNARSGG